VEIGIQKQRRNKYISVLPIPEIEKPKEESSKNNPVESVQCIPPGEWLLCDACYEIVLQSKCRYDELNPGDFNEWCICGIEEELFDPTHCYHCNEPYGCPYHMYTVRIHE
jgi:hypothetical protein